MLVWSQNLVLLVSLAWHCISAQVNVDVIGPWPEYCDSEIVETGTHLYHQVSADAFWSFLDRMALVKDLPARMPTGLLTGFGLLEGKDQARLLKTAIQLRSHANVADIYKTMLGNLKEKIVPKSDSCKSFVQVGKKTACKVSDAEELLVKLEEGKIKGLGADAVVDGFDRVWTRNLKGLPVVILWADASDKEGLAMHQLLKEQAKSYKITYVYRYRIRNTGCELKKSEIHLKGFGASFEVKSGGIVHPVLKAKIAEATGVTDAQDEFETEFNKEYSEIGIKTAKLIAKSKKPFETFQTLVCNLPAAVKSISKAIQVTEKDKSSLTEMQRSSFMFPHSDVINVNGVLVEPGAFSLQGLASFSSDYAKLYAGISAAVDTELSEVILKSSLTKKAPTFAVESNSVLYLNDLEKDETYAKHSSSLRSVLRYSESGFFDIKRNLMTAIVCLDVGAGEAAYKVLNKLMKGWVQRGAPIRFGLLLGNYRESDQFRLAIIATLAIEKCMKDEEMEDLPKLYKEMLSLEGLKEQVTLEELLEMQEHRDRYRSGFELTKNMSLTLEPSLFLNGRHYNFNEFDFEMIQSYRAEITELQPAIYKGELEDSVEDIYGHLLNARGALSHRHLVLFRPNPIPVAFDYTQMSKESFDLLQRPSLFLYPPWLNAQERTKVTATVWLVVNAKERYELDLIKSAMTFIKQTKQSCRLRLVFTNPVNEDLQTVLRGYSELAKGQIYFEKYADFLERTLNLRQTSTTHLRPPVEKGKKLSSTDEMLWDHLNMVSELLGATGLDGEYVAPLIYLNGRFVGQISKKEEPLIADHFEVLLKQELSQRLAYYTKVLEGKSGDWAELALKMTVFEIKVFDSLRSNFGAGGLHFNAAPDVVPPFPSFKTGDSGALIKVSAVIDPLTPLAQRFSSMMMSLQEESWLRTEVFLNPHVMLAHLPLPNLYLYYPHHLQQQANDYSQLYPAKGNKFALLLDVPPAWETINHDTGDIADPDNLSEDLKGTIGVKVRSLLAEVKVEAIGVGKVSLAGLQVIAKDSLEENELESKPLMGDMNVAHFSKLGNKPFKLALDPSYKDEFELLNAPRVSFVNSLGRNTVTLLVKQNDIPKRSYSLPRSKDSEVINVFSIASGLTYERLIRIMMMSVMKKTKSPVKFWLVDNFVSPDFRESIEKLAKHLGFSYEFVQIRWPTWLRPQLRKHRLVWAYKILFLDQFFADRSVKRVVYVDADQVVRADLADLVKTDMKGAAWGFVPFCDSRKETDGYRFWKTGYWKSILTDNGLSYHISALFLVDFEVFNAQGLPTRLRRDYHLLTADPNSLANLDQDLPNQLQADHPIFSLPQEWLWCETWCDDESKLTAKSIDLCNWPGSKETKVEQGKRIIPEWSEYDHEIDVVLKSNISDKIDL